MKKNHKSHIFLGVTAATPTPVDPPLKGILMLFKKIKIKKGKKGSCV